MQKNKNIELKIFESADDMNEAVANFILQLAKASVRQRGRFVLSISGGETPKALYSLLSKTPYSTNVPWGKTYVFWGDERCVPEDDENNNAHMAKTILFNNIDIPSSNIFPVSTHMPPAEAARTYEETIKIFFGHAVPSFDLILLGLGEDGHTASLFPGTDVVHEKSRFVKEVFVETQQLFRVTMTAPLINKAQHIAFLVTGENKSDILNAVINGDYQPEKYPAQLIKPEQGKTYWYADLKAAKHFHDSFQTVFSKKLKK